MAGREPTSEEKDQVLTGYRLRWTASLPDPRPENKKGASGMLTLRVWDPGAKHFPGWNPPIVEIYSGTLRLNCQELSEVGWAVDVWSVSHQGSFLYVRTKHRHRFAEGENVYELNPNGMKLEHKGVYFSKEELVRENTDKKSRLEQLSKPNGEQAAPSNEVPDIIVSCTRSPNDQYSIGLDGTLGPPDPVYWEFDTHQARLLDRKTGKFTGRKIPLTPTATHAIDMRNKIIGKGGWGAIWHPDSTFVILMVPVLEGKNDGPHAEYFYFQVTETGILPMAVPNLEAHVFRSFDRDEEIGIGRITPKGWIEGNRLGVDISGSHFDGGEAPDFLLSGILKFHQDGNVTVDAIVKEHADQAPQDEETK